MAQTDTGLGWSADSAYLMLSAGEMCTFGGFEISGYPGLPLPVTGPSAQDIYTNGYKVLEGYDKEVYAGAAVNNCFVDAVANTGGFSLYFIAPTNETDAIYWVERNKTSGAFSNVKLRTCSSQAAVSHGVQFYSSGAEAFLYWDTNIVFYAPHYNRDREYVAALTFNGTPIYKLNSGYAVACIATWITPDGVTITSPVLISTSADNATLSLDGTTPASQGRAAILYDGVRFIMSYLTNLDGYGSGGVPIVDLSQFAAATPEKVFRILATDSFANIIVGESPDPYQQEGEESGEEGGDGEDQEDDPVEEETLPLPSVAGHGFCTIYVPTMQQLNQMSSYLWSGAFDVDQVIKLFSNPMDSILGLSAVPVDLVGTLEQIYLGGVPLTNVSMPKYTGRTSVKVDFGTMTIDERWGSYLDYDPYTELSIYLPFIGIKPLKADDVMGKTISLMYAIDILSGGCVAYIRPAGGSVLYEWSGQCGIQIPVTARNYDNVFQTAMSVVGAIGAAVVAPASAPVLPGSVASAAVQAAATKPRIERSGTVNGITGFLGQLRPYLIRTIPEAFIPADQNTFIGYPAYINVDLAAVRGYNVVESIHLENVTATGAELEEIESILKGGVIF